jgi:hypothetical protein
MTKDVLSEEKITGGAQGTVAGAARPEERKGIFKVVEVHDLEQWTLQGWRPVRTIETTRLVADREDVPVPVGAQPHYPPCERDLVVGRDGHRQPLTLERSDDPRVLSLVKTSHVPKTLFLLQLDEHSALANADVQLQAEKARASEATHAKADALRLLGEQEKQTKELRASLAHATRQHAEKNEAYNVQVTRNRAMETDFGKLRQDHKKLAAALGDLKVKEILGA